MRTALHGAVARFGGAALPRIERFLLVEQQRTCATSDTPVALRVVRTELKIRTYSKSQDRLTTHDVNRTQLPRSGMTSSFALARLLELLGAHDCSWTLV